MTELNRWWWWWRVASPLFFVDVRLPFFTIRTSTMTYQFDRAEYEYGVFQVSFFKWHCELSLYDTLRRIMERQRHD